MDLKLKITREYTEYQLWVSQLKAWDSRLTMHDTKLQELLPNLRGVNNKDVTAQSAVIAGLKGEIVEVMVSVDKNKSLLQAALDIAQTDAELPNDMAMPSSATIKTQVQAMRKKVDEEVKTIESLIKRVERPDWAKGPSTLSANAPKI